MPNIQFAVKLGSFDERNFLLMKDKWNLIKALMKEIYMSFYSI